jgi:hypothetical protein
MHVRSLISLGFSLLACTIAMGAASAAEGEIDLKTMTTKHKRAFIGLTGGAAYAIVEHPMIKSNGFAAASLGLHFGYTVAEKWTIGLEIMTVEHGMKRQSAYEPFTPTSMLQPQAGCNNCEPPPKGGYVTETTAMFGMAGPRVEFSPLGRDGVYLGATAGVGTLLGVDTLYGFGGGARAGYRYRFANVLAIGVEGGLQAQYFSTGAMLFPYAAVLMRPYF